MKNEDFYRAFCTQLALREVPTGFVLKTPFRRPDGDAVALYLRRMDGGGFRIEDDGETVGAIEAAGVDLDGESRFEAFSNLLQEHGAHFDEAEYIIHSDTINKTDVPLVAVQFSVLLLRIVDLVLLYSNRVRSTFRDDLIDLVERQFGSAARISFDAPLQDSKRVYLVDIIVRSADGRALVIFTGSSELRALEALLLWKEYRDQDIANTRAMLVVETSKPQAIKARTFSRLMNSGLLLASMDDEEIAIRRKMKENLIS